MYQPCPCAHNGTYGCLSSRASRGRVALTSADDQAVALYESGRQAAQEFLERWNFESYKQQFRTGQIKSRTEDMAQLLTGGATRTGQ